MLSVASTADCKLVCFQWRYESKDRSAAVIKDVHLCAMVSARGSEWSEKWGEVMQ